jgi:two-component system, OmpR family, phosphate regulon sensor histidine kinase PhoR
VSSGATNRGGAESPLQAATRRLSEARWLLAASGVVLIVLVFAGLIGLPAALIIFAAFIVLTAVIRRDGMSAPPAAVAAPAAQPWPETGIKLFAEALPDPCMVLDGRGIVRYANQRAIDAFAIRPGDPLTARLRVPDLLAAFDRVAKGGPAEGVQFAQRVPTERWFAAWFVRLDPGRRRDSLVALIVDDLTEPRRSERIRVDFVANASHELRTPLASLVGFIDTLRGPARDDAVARDRFLRVMQEQATRMSRLIDDLLSLSRVEMKAHVRPSGDVDLVAVIRHLSDALEPLARDLKVTIRTDLPEAPVRVVGDRDELIQVFENLMENACKYGQPGGHIEVSVVPADERSGAIVSVRDHGPGIPEEHIPRLTERFYRIDVDASRAHRGTGLGLAIVKHILARHQARMAIESRLGEGSTFTVVFPLAEAATESGPQGNREETQGFELSS